MKYLGIGLLLAVMTAAPAFAAGQNGEAAGITEVRYMTYHIGADPAADLEAQLIQEFQERFEGQYRLVVEEVPGDHAYTEKLKTLILSKQMPDVWEGKEPEFNYKAWKAGKAMDLTPLLERDSFFREHFVAEAIDVQKRDWDGQIPWMNFRYPTEWGYFYNKELFRKAGIEAPARSWDEFWEQCRKLKAIGVYPIAMQTADNAWLSGHWLWALIASKGPQGQAFVSTPDPADYQVPEFIDSITELQMMLQDYAQPDAVGANYNLAAASFHGEKAAMISNGPWQISSFKDPDTVGEGFYEKVGWTVFPEGSYVGGISRVTSGLAINPERGEKVIDAALEFLKIMQEDWFASESFRQLGHRGYGNTISEEAFASNPLLKVWEEEKAAYGTTALIGYQDILHRTVSDALQSYLPLLAFDEMSPQDFAAKMNEIAAKQ